MKYSSQVQEYLVGVLLLQCTSLRNLEALCMLFEGFHELVIARIDE